MEPFLIPLKEKYLLHKSFKCGRYKPRAGNSDGRKKLKSIAKALSDSAKARGR